MSDWTTEYHQWTRHPCAFGISIQRSLARDCLPKSPASENFPSYPVNHIRPCPIHPYINYAPPPPPPDFPATWILNRWLVHPRSQIEDITFYSIQKLGESQSEAPLFHRNSFRSVICVYIFACFCISKFMVGFGLKVKDGADGYRWEVKRGRFASKRWI